jgi:GntR family transcriptional regulator
MSMSTINSFHPALAGVQPSSIIDKVSPVPLHYQLERFLREGIESGRFAPHSTLPTEQDLQDHFDLSRTPIRQAIGKLVADGLVVRRRSQGTVVLPRPFEEDLQSLSSFTEEVERHGQRPRARLLEFVVQSADQEDAQQLALAQSAEVYHIRRLRLIDQAPVGLIVSHVPVGLVPHLKPEDFHETGAQQSLYYVLEKVHGLKLVHASEIFDAVSLNEASAALLELPPLRPILSRSRVTYTQGGQAVAFEQGLYRVRYRLQWQGRALSQVDTGLVHAGRDGETIPTLSP